MLRVLMLSASPHPMIREMLGELKKRAVEVELAVLLEMDRLKIIRDAFRFLPKFILRDLRLLPRIARILLKARSLRALKWIACAFALASVAEEFCSRASFDLFHAFWAYPSGLAFVLLRGVTRRPLVVSVLGYDVDERTFEDPALVEITRWVLKEAEAVVVGARNHRENVLRLGIEEGKVWFIHPGVNIERFNPRVSGEAVRRRLGLGSEDLVVGFGPRLASIYGPEDFVRAAAVASKEVPSAVFVMMGEGPLRRELEKLAGRLGARVLFTGEVPYRDMPFYYAAMDVYCTPCHLGQGVSALEAMSSGKPVVGYDVGDVKVRNGVEGLLARPADVGDLARKLILLLSEHELRGEMGRRAREGVLSRYSISAYAERNLAVYESLRGGA